MMPVERHKHITREQARANRDALFVFGDNFARHGLGGLAAELRGELNAVGIPTKFTPSNKPEDFLGDQHVGFWLSTTSKEWIRLYNHLVTGGTVVLPAAGIGTGLAQLPKKAPVIFAIICAHFHVMEKEF